MLRSEAKYVFGVPFARIMPLNGDKTIPTPSRMLGGAGPFDFSGADSLAEIPLTIKIDAAAEATVNVDLSGAGDSTAVTVTELRDAIIAAGPTDITASVDGTTGRIKLAYSGAGSPVWVQVYGECARIAGFGQGKGLKFIKTNTLKSVSDSPTLKESETFTTTDAGGVDTEIVSDGYRKGSTLTFVDAAEDLRMLEVFEGGEYDEDEGTYEASTSATVKPYFLVEVYTGRYSEGTNKEADIVDYERKLFRSCVGSVGERTHERGWSDCNLSAIATTYHDENDNMLADLAIQILTVEEYETLDVLNV